MFKRLANHLPYFAAVAKHLSFSQAAIELAVSQSSISYQIKSLEDKLGYKVFIRGQGSGVQITEKGSVLFEEFIVLERNFNQVVLDTQINQSMTSLDMTAPIDIGVKIVTPAISSLVQAGVTVNLDLSDKVVEFKKSAFDFSIRNNTNEEGLEYLPLFTAKNVLVCSKIYAEQHKLSSALQINEQHRLIVRHAQRSKSWNGLLASAGKALEQHQNKLVISNSHGIYQAMSDHIGIAILPEYFIETSKFDDLFIFSDPIIETQYFLAFQPSYIASRWAGKLKDSIHKYFELH